jgi:hypothetical protein
VDADLHRKLPRPLVINLTTLADVRALIERHLPSDRRDVPTWRYVRKKLDEAARGGDPPQMGEIFEVDVGQIIKARIDAYREEKPSGWRPPFFQVTAAEL